jgi:hypothetical protein
MAPPQRSPVFFRSATSDLSCSFSDAVSGRRHRSSPERCAASRMPSTTGPSGPMAAAVVGPRATTQAPVSVATSTRAAGSIRTAQARTSPRTSRPSASVFVTCTVLPFAARRTSEGL